MQQCLRCGQRYPLRVAGPPRCPACGEPASPPQVKVTPKQVPRTSVRGYRFAMAFMGWQVIQFSLFFIFFAALARPCPPAQFDLFCGANWFTPMTLALAAGIVLAALVAAGKGPTDPRTFEVASVMAWLSAVSTFVVALVQGPDYWEFPLAFAALLAVPVVGTFVGTRTWRQALRAPAPSSFDGNRG